MRRSLATGLLGATFAAAAALLDSEPLWVPATTLVLIAVGGWAWVVLATRTLRVRRTLAARTVIEAEPLEIVIDVGGGRVGMPAARITDPLLAAPAPLRAGARDGRIRIEARFGRRGRRVLARPLVVVADPLGLATREVAARPSPAADEVLVLPRIEAIVTTPFGGADSARILHGARPFAGAQIELDGIRPLRDGTPAARIYWPAVARGAEPQERALAAATDGRPVVVLDPRGAVDEEALDAAVRAAASLAHALGRAGGCGVLLPGDRRPVALRETLSGWAQLHARLALVGPDGRPALSSLAQRPGPIVHISARPRTRMPSALGPSHGAARVLVVPGEPAMPRAAFTVGGCTGYLLSGAQARRARAGDAVRAART